MATGAAGTGKTFEVSADALTDEEIKLLANVTGQKRARIAPFRHYYVWVFITGIALSYSGGAIAHSYYGAPLVSARHSSGDGALRLFHSGCDDLPLAGCDRDPPDFGPEIAQAQGNSPSANE